MFLKEHSIKWYVDYLEHSRQKLKGKYIEQKQQKKKTFIFKQIKMSGVLI